MAANEGLIFVEDYVKFLLKDRDFTVEEVAKRMGVTSGMVSQYKLSKRLPTIRTALHVFKTDGIALHPYSEKSLRYIIKNS